MYIYEHPDWPHFIWDHKKIEGLLTPVRYLQGRFLGKMETLGFQLKEQAVFQTLTQDVLKTSEIEGESLNVEEVRSSLARRLNVTLPDLVPSGLEVEGVVTMLLDATAYDQQPLSQERLFSWHASLFPTGKSGFNTLKTGTWRDDSQGPMQVVSGPYGRERIHYQAPPAPKIAQEMQHFLDWFNQETPLDGVLKAALAHLWFVTLHPFEDGNGRIARAISDRVLAHCEQSSHRFYSLSLQISHERRAYYQILEKTQKGTLDVTPWIEWFLGSLERAIKGADNMLQSVLYKAHVWEKLSTTHLNERQRSVLNRWLDGFEGNLTTTKWAKLCNCSQDTANRDIITLVKQGILQRNPGGGRSTSYSVSPFS
jgi:Fic family protein